MEWTQTLLFANLAEYAYKKSIPKEFTKGFDVEFLEREDTELWVLSNSNTIILIYRGTEFFSIRDILNDLDTKLVKYKDYGFVHQGFLTVVGRISFLKLMQEKNPNKDKTIYCIGHSLGGACAALAGIRLADTGYKIGGVYTFGMPAIGDALFCKTWKDKMSNLTWRFRLNRDPIPLFPWNGYEQIGKQIFIRNGEAEIKDDNWKSYLDKLPFWILVIIARHRMVHYISEIKALSDNNHTLQ